MNRRHSALVTLAAWILIQPPSIQKAGKLDISANAPLFDWEQVQTFDTAAACEKDRQDVIDCGKVLNGDKQGTVVEACGYSGPKRGATKDKGQADLIAAIAGRKMAARCVSDNDPHLKSK
jgi:hypothetical protein